METLLEILNDIDDTVNWEDEYYAAFDYFKYIEK